MKREIYNILFNKFFSGDRIRCDEYALDVEAPIGKTPQSIAIKDDRVTICFTDGCRHVFPYDERVEFFDREIEVKKKKDADTQG